MKLFFVFILFSGLAFGEDSFGYLDSADQKYFKNDSMEGNNQRERIDLNVKEINKLTGEIATLKSQVQDLRKDVDELKKK